MSDNPLYRERGATISSEIERMTQLEWPLHVSADVLPSDLQGKLVGDIGAGPSPGLGALVKARGGQYVAFDKNFEMARRQKNTDPGHDAVQADIIRLPLLDNALDIAHTRFVFMNLPAAMRPAAIRELARCARTNIVIDYDWTPFRSENPSVESFIKGAKELGQLAGSDLNHGSKLKQLVTNTLSGKQVSERIFNQGPIKDYTALAALAKSMQGLAANLRATEEDAANKEGRPIRASLLGSVEHTAHSMALLESEFSKTASQQDQENVTPFVSPDIVTVTF